MSEGDSQDNRRRHQRTPISLLVQYRFNSFEDFLAEYAVNLSPGGMFIHTSEPSPMGSMLSLQFSLKDGSRLIEGLVKVVRVIPVGTPGETPGMGVEFVRFDEDSRNLINQICRPKTP